MAGRGRQQGGGELPEVAVRGLLGEEGILLSAVHPSCKTCNVPYRCPKAARPKFSGLVLTQKLPWSVLG